MSFGIMGTSAAFAKVAGRGGKGTSAGALILRASAANPFIYSLSCSGDVVVVSTKNGEKKSVTYTGLSNAFISLDADANTDIIVSGNITSITLGASGQYTLTSPYTKIYTKGKITSLTSFSVAFCDTLQMLNVRGFVSLTSLTLSNCASITSLDLSANTALTSLKFFNCASITSLDLSANTALTSFDASYCTGITSLDLSANTALTSLTLSNCASITSLDLSANTALTSLKFFNCASITSLDLSANTALTSLTLNNCASITSLDLSANTALTSFDASYCTGITSLDLSANTALTSLTLNGCASITSLDLSANTALTSLRANDCSGLVYFDLGTGNYSSVYANNCTSLKEIHALFNTNPSTNFGISNLPNIQRIYVNSYSSHLSNAMAAAMTASNSSDGTLYTDSNGSYYSTLETAAQAKGWTIEPLPA